MVNPVRDLPRAIFISCTLCTLWVGGGSIPFCIYRRIPYPSQILCAGQRCLLCGHFSRGIAWIQCNRSDGKFLSVKNKCSFYFLQFANKFYGVFAFTMPILVAGSCFGTVNGVMLTSSRWKMWKECSLKCIFRLFFVAGRNEHMPSILSYINPYWNTPIPAVLFTVEI